MIDWMYASLDDMDIPETTANQQAIAEGMMKPKELSPEEEKERLWNLVVQTARG